MSAHAERDRARLRVAFRGAVQGVGFRPFIYRLATELGLTGYVTNTPNGALAEAEGRRDQLEAFLIRSQREVPPRASIQSLEASWLDPVGYADFIIRPSLQEGAREAFILPDIATCADCLRELNDPSDRRYRYPFINCTNCGPRYSIILRLPYDRPHTTMSRFRMCEACQQEYENPLDRRFHAQPNACPVCGPHVELWDPEGRCLADRDEAIQGAIAAVKEGQIVAVKGLGGFHLMVDAANDDAVQHLRRLKRREAKPLAVMFPDVNSAARVCALSVLERRALESPERPIVLLSKLPEAEDLIAPSVAPNNPQVGAMLPYTPLHHLLLEGIARPVVATSGNLSDEPICTDEHEAVQRLTGIADLFLVHDRPIARHVDDSVVRVVRDREQVLRRARGYAPLPVLLPASGPTALAVGPHLKCSVALAVGRSAYVSQHIGDLDTVGAREAHVRVVRDLIALYEERPAVIVTDLHPDYASTLTAEMLAAEMAANGTAPQTLPVQHHYAHILACMAENEITGQVLGVAWDGTGLGTDGTIWGGEWLLCTPSRFERVAHLRSFRLPGGDAAMREPRRSAIGTLYEMYGAAANDKLPASVPTAMVQVWLKMLERGTNVSRTTSAGRLFDAVASLLDICQVARFEGQAAMELEWAMGANGPLEPYRLEMRQEGGALTVDWQPLIEGIVADAAKGVPLPEISRGFHDALVEGIVSVARAVGEKSIVLSGGCFQNRYLTEKACERLTAEGFRVYVHQRVPPNDGGIALGQVYAAVGRLYEAK